MTEKTARVPKSTRSKLPQKHPLKSKNILSRLLTWATIGLKHM